MIDITKDPSGRFDEILVSELTKRLKRQPTAGEVTNSDNDSDLVNEVLWQMVSELAEKIAPIEDNFATLTKNAVP